MNRHRRFFPGEPKPPSCSCAAYPFPHRAGGGTCRGYVTTTYRGWLPDGSARTNVRHTLSPICSACGEVPEDVRQVDLGIGPYEFWGATGTDVQWVTVSDCCEAELRPNRPTSKPTSAPIAETNPQRADSNLKQV